MEGGVLIVFVIILIFVLCHKVTHRDGLIVGDQRISVDAQVTGVTVDKVGAKGARRYRTTVCFSDGSKYVAYDTNVENGVFMYRIELTAEMRAEIIIRALLAHVTECRETGLISQKEYESRYKDIIEVRRQVRQREPIVNHNIADTPTVENNNPCEICGTKNVELYKCVSSDGIRRNVCSYCMERYGYKKEE